MDQDMIQAFSPLTAYEPFDVTVNIDAGLSSMRIVVPEGTAAQVIPSDDMRNIYVTGTWEKHGSKYVNDGDRPRLTIIPDVGAGELQLSNK